MISHTNLALALDAGASMHPDRQVDTIVRFHDPARLQELERCIFSLLGQAWRPIHIHLVMQRFSHAAEQATRQRLSRLQKFPNAPRISFLNYQGQGLSDARSALMNFGLNNCDGRYLGFLDYDDVLYPEAYELLIERVEKTGCSIAFATVRAMRVELYERFIYLEKDVSEDRFIGSSLVDLFKNNFAPIHSYIIDRSRVSPDVLYFDETEPPR